jgi:xanthine dehydrogenase accessory factor
MLASPADDPSDQRRLQRFALGPTLGQCCGGVVQLMFERIESSAHEFFIGLQRRWLQGQDSWRLIAVDANTPASLYDHDGHCLAGPAQAVLADFDFNAGHSCRLVQDAAGKCWLVDPCLPYRAQLFLFGAGHVGAAIVRSLAELPCRVTWIDERDDIFPAVLPANVTCEMTDIPEAVIDAAPAGASYLVMTHSHALDQRLAEHILRRADIGWFGLIGSRTKRIQFERRLRARGLSAERLADMVCPIGIAGITGKAPATIAIAVAAQLMQVWERQQLCAVAVERNAKKFQENIQ